MEPKTCSFTDSQLERAYYYHGKKLTEHIREASDMFIKEALDEEVLQTDKEQLEKEGKDSAAVAERLKEVQKMNLLGIVGLDVVYDMGWQKRSSGRRHDSKSGHALMVRLKTNKIIGVILYCKDCHICIATRDRGEAPPLHPNCPHNYDGSPKSMESDGACKIVSEMFDNYNKKVYIKHFLGDDDSTTRSQLVIKTDKNKGHVPNDYPVKVLFWADVNHRVKCMVKPLFALAQLSQRISECKKDDALRKEILVCIFNVAGRIQRIHLKNL